MDDLIARAKHALENTSPSNIAERLSLFRELVAALDDLHVTRITNADARRELQIASRELQRYLYAIHEAADDWNLGMGISREVRERVRAIVRLLIEIQQLSL